jgi:hypothetical protein
VLVVKVPKTFVDDHDSRGLMERGLASAVVKATKTNYTLSLTPEEFAELLDDARHYADGGCEMFGWEYRGLIASARATVKALEQGKEGTK